MSKAVCLPASYFLVGMLLLASLCLPSLASAHSTTSHRSLSSASKGLSNGGLTCSPAPCVLPNVQASGGNGPYYFTTDDPIATSPIYPQDLLTAGLDDNCGNGLGFYSSGNGGTSWSSWCMWTVVGYSGVNYPGVGFDLNGNSYETGVYELEASASTSVFFEKNGHNYLSPTLAVPPLFSGGIVNYSWLQIDDSASSPYANALYISATQTDPSQKETTISVSHSTNGGSTWSMVQVDATQTVPEVDQFSDLAISKNGTIYVTWLRCSMSSQGKTCANTLSQVYISASTDGGNTWSPPVVVATVHLAPNTCGCQNSFYGNLPNTTQRLSEIAAIGVDNSSGSHAGNLYVVFYTWTGTHMKVEVTTSTDGGNTWGNPISVAPASDTHDQFFPWLSVSPLGAVGVTWLDRRNDPNNFEYEEYGAVSFNGATSFGANQQLAAAPSNPDANDEQGYTYFPLGDLTGNAWDGTTLVASWMDSSNGGYTQDYVGGILGTSR